MNIHYNLNDFEELNYPVVTMGSFDGVHLGHLQILSKMVEIARKEQGESVLFTFYPHPQQILFPNLQSLKFINTQAEKIELLRKAQIDHLIIFPFSLAFSKISSKDFIHQFLVDKLHVKKLISGYDHHFGNKREGNYKSLSELGQLYGFEVEEVQALKVNNIAVSSTEIRNALSVGNIKLANTYLGYNYSITGTVILGNQIGKKIGFPTANIEIDDKHKLIPANGVYAVYINIESIIYKGMANIGTRPTLNLKEKSFEVHIFNFDNEIYNKSITVKFIDRIRDEYKFSDLDALKTQLAIDKNNALNILL
ncbi:MAG: riboflavin biosynthesis protein RibF [Bacteroidetes bacterium CG2_30_32_10]|nr:MAG: riboflavin biosynthesis protein RibF [Bacteroidetes bacterium CG2_30_32_10]